MTSAFKLTYSTMFDPPPALHEQFEAALARGISFAVRGNLVLLAPPLVVTDAELDRALDVLDELLAAHIEPLIRKRSGP